ncbi:MAG: peptidoglycan-binding protein [Firmicutes bacterium]|nr:peptidoglycan-binding protein [Bacillota bacterium]
MFKNKFLTLLLAFVLVASYSFCGPVAVSAEPSDSGANIGVLSNSDNEIGAMEEETTETAAEEPEQVNTEPYPGPWPALPGGADVIAKKAIDLAWPYGTPKSQYSYPNGSPTPEFQKALDLVYPDRSGWGKQARTGASCDVFVGTVIRYSGYDTSAPRGVTPALKYYKNYPEKWERTGICKVADMQPGDVIVWSKKSGTKHTCIYVEINGVGYLAEAHYCSKKFGCIDKKAFNYKKSDYKSFNIYRACAPFSGPLERGYAGNSVVELQNFLNWAGFDCGAADGVYNKQTEAAVMAFQKAVGLYADGKFGKQALEVAKTYIPANPQVLHQYPGKFPKVGKKGLKYKSKKHKQVKRMQKFLNWYGNYNLKVDGDFGKATRKAVKKFQSAEKLKVDGIFGKASLKRAKLIRK